MEYNPPLRRVDEVDDDLETLEPGPNEAFYLLDPAVRYIWFVGRSIFWGIVTVFTVIVGVLGRVADAIWAPYILPGVIVLGLLAILNLLWPFISYRHWGYAIRDKDLLIRSGVLWKRISAVPFSRIQHVDSHAGPFERTMDIANLVIHTAGSHMGRLEVPGLATEHAEELRDFLSEVGHTHANI